MATTRIIPLHTGKGRTVATALGLRVDYVENPDKTDDGEWVTAYECDPLIVDKEFMFSKNQYAAITGRNQGARDVIAYHLRISFKPGETDAATANRIGYELAYKLTHGNHAFVCCTHVDRHHIHSHIVINSTSIDCLRKFRNFKGSSFAVRRIADHLCLENGLSIVENPKPSRGSYGKWQGDLKPVSNREKLERIIDGALQNAKDYDAFIAAMIAAGCEVKQGANLAFKIPGADRFARCKTLGEDYSEDAIRERLAGLRKVAPRVEVFVPFIITRETEFGLLIDIQKKVQEGKGEAYEQWAKIYNIKQMAKTLIFLQENKLLDYNHLARETRAVSSRYHNRLNRIKEIEDRQKEISALQKQIGTYGKTRETYAVYLHLKNTKPPLLSKLFNEVPPAEKFYEDNRADITLHEAAKRYFDEHGYGKNNKLPSINSLKQEWAALEAEKKTLYRDYHQLKDLHKKLNTAKDNCDRLFGLKREEPARVQQKQRHYSRER